MPLSRRSFLAAGLSSGLLGADARKVRLGGPIFLKTDDPGEMAREHRRLGYSAAYCPKAEASDAVRVKSISDAFAKENVVIAEVGAWVNMLEADATKRKANLAYVTSRLQLAEAVGARNCVNIAGSFNPVQWDGPDPRNLTKEYVDVTVENCRKVIDAVNPKRTKFTIEMMGWSLPDGPESYLQLLRAVDREGFGVHIDVCNIVNSPERYYHNSALIEDCFQKLGKWVMSCHAKDLAGRSVHFAETVPGRGGLDYRAYLRAIVTHAPDAPLMLEHLSTAQEYDEGREFITKTGREIGIAFA